MFNNDQFDVLHLIWDGRPINFETCKKCGYACCIKTEKWLFPGELNYLSSKSIISIDKTCSDNDSCVCIKIGIKSIMCKLYPLYINTDMTVRYDTCYSSKCKDLIYDEKKLHDFLTYLFSDKENFEKYHRSFLHDIT